jgi:hypothetical protein
VGLSAAAYCLVSNMLGVLPAAAAWLLLASMAAAQQQQ